MTGSQQSCTSVLPRPPRSVFQVSWEGWPGPQPAPPLPELHPFPSPPSLLW